MIQDDVVGCSIFSRENDDIILMLLVCMYRCLVLISERVNVEKEADHLYLDKDEWLDGVGGWTNVYDHINKILYLFCLSNILGS